MDKTDKSATFAVPKESVSSERAGWTPEEVAQYIGFQLSELAGTNAHHEFERLCFHLAQPRAERRKRPCRLQAERGLSGKNSR
jgi:hypothetical protein